MPTVWLNQTTLIPNDPSLAPYADWQLGRLLANNHGVIGFWQLIGLSVVIPTILDLVALLLVSLDTYDDLIESA